MPVDERNHETLFPAISGSAWRLAQGGALAAAADVPAELRAGDFLVGGADCGRGASNRLPYELRARGVQIVIATSIDPQFFERAVRAGLPAVAIEEAAAIQPGDRLRVDIETFRVVNLNSGDRYIIRNLTEEHLARLRQTRPS